MTMQCQDVQERIPLWTAGLLSEKLVRQVETHLARCESCRRVADQERSVARALDEVVAAGDYGSVWADVATGLRESRRRRIGRWNSVALATAAALVVMMLFWFRPGMDRVRVRLPDIRMARLDPVLVRTPEFRERVADLQVRNLTPNVVWITTGN